MTPQKDVATFPNLLSGSNLVPTWASFIFFAAKNGKHLPTSGKSETLPRAKVFLSDSSGIFESDE